LQSSANFITSLYLELYLIPAPTIITEHFEDPINFAAFLIFSLFPFCLLSFSNDGFLKLILYLFEAANIFLGKFTQTGPF